MDPRQFTCDSAVASLAHSQCLFSQLRLGVAVYCLFTTQKGPSGLSTVHSRKPAFLFLFVHMTHVCSCLELQMVVSHQRWALRIEFWALSNSLQYISKNNSSSLVSGLGSWLLLQLCWEVLNNPFHVFRDPTSKNHFTSFY